MQLEKYARAHKELIFQKMGVILKCVADFSNRFLELFLQF